MFDMIATSSPWDDMWRTMDALMQYPSINKDRSIEKTGLKSLISRPHNIVNVKDKDGNIVAQRLEVVTTPFEKDGVKVSVKNNVLTVKCGKVNRVVEPELDTSPVAEPKTDKSKPWYSKDNLKACEREQVKKDLDISEEMQGIMENEQGDNVMCEFTQDSYIYKGISTQDYQFSVKLGDNIDKSNIKAKNQDGVLTITLPFFKKEDKKDDSTEITVE